MNSAQDTLRMPDEDAMDVADALLKRTPLFTRDSKDVSRDLRDLVAGADVCIDEGKPNEALKYIVAAVAGLTDCNADELSKQTVDVLLKRNLALNRELFGDTSMQASEAKAKLDAFVTAADVRAKPDLRQVAQQSPLGIRCWNVGCRSADAATKVCGRCKTALYCSEECQRADWSTGHKAQCTKIVGPPPPR
jgi:hypothetical protein